MSLPPCPPNVQERPAAEAVRDPKGRFVRGNKAGQGNPFGRTMASRRWLITSAVSEEALVEIMDTLVILAKEGDVGAAKLVLQYAIGKPLPMAEPDRVEIEDWDLHKESVVMENDMEMIRTGSTVRSCNILAGLLDIVKDTQMTEACDVEYKNLTAKWAEHDARKKAAADAAEAKANEEDWLAKLGRGNDAMAAANCAAGASRVSGDRPSKSTSNGRAANDRVKTPKGRVEASARPSDGRNFGRAAE